MAEPLCLVIAWHDGETAGYSDVFGPAEFRDALDGARRTHLVSGPRSYVGTATYLLRTRAQAATLDYAAFPAENTRAGMLLGVMQLTFSDASRSTVTRVDWATGPTGPFRKANVTVGYESCPKPPRYRPAPGANAKRRVARVKDRPGQAEFRALLMVAYGSRCCISGCAVAEALDGAHIDPFENFTHDAPQNGLLLRKDLHALFDANLIRVEHSGLRIVVADSVRGDPEYAKLHDRTIRPPEAGYGDWGPDPAALRRRAGS